MVTRRTSRKKEKGRDRDLSGPRHVRRRRLACSLPKLGRAPPVRSSRGLRLKTESFQQRPSETHGSRRPPDQLLWIAGLTSKDSARHRKLQQPTKAHISSRQVQGFRNVIILKAPELLTNPPLPPNMCGGVSDAGPLGQAGGGRPRTREETRSWERGKRCNGWPPGRDPAGPGQRALQLQAESVQVDRQHASSPRLSRPSKLHSHGIRRVSLPSEPL